MRQSLGALRQRVLSFVERLDDGVGVAHRVARRRGDVLDLRRGFVDRSTELGEPLAKLVFKRGKIAASLVDHRVQRGVGLAEPVEQDGQLCANLLVRRQQSRNRVLRAGLQRQRQRLARSDERVRQLVALHAEARDKGVAGVFDGGRRQIGNRGQFLSDSPAPLIEHRVHLRESRVERAADLGDSFGERLAEIAGARVQRRIEFVPRVGQNLFDVVQPRADRVHDQPASFVKLRRDRAEPADDIGLEKIDATVEDRLQRLGLAPQGFVDLLSPRRQSLGEFARSRQENPVDVFDLCVQAPA